MTILGGRLLHFIEHLHAPSRTGALQLLGDFGRPFLIQTPHARFDPGQSTGLHTPTLKSVGICVSPARIEYSEPGGKTEVADLSAGQFNWHPEPRTHSLKNVGTTRFEAVEIEWKGRNWGQSWFMGLLNIMSFV